MKYIYHKKTNLDRERMRITLKTTGIVRKIDELGRVVLPIEMRKTLHIQIRDAVEIQMQDNTIVIKKYEPSKENCCAFCSSQQNLKKFKENWVCESCLKELSGK